MAKKHYSHWLIVLTSTGFIAQTIRNLRNVKLMYKDLLNNYSKIASITSYVYFSFIVK